MKAALYVRLSSYRGAADPSTSPERQEEIGRNYAAARGWNVSTVIRDLDVSGSSKGERLDRSGLRDVRNLFGQIDVLIVSKVDRLARDTLDFLAFAEECDRNGVALVSVAESLDMTTPGGKFTATILAAFAEMEAKTISERTAAGRAGTISAGRYPGGRVPYGYRTVPHASGAGRGLDVVPEEAAHIRSAAAHVIAGGTLYSAVQLIGAHGSVPRTAPTWTSASLRVVLMNTVLLGYQKEQGRDVLSSDGTPAVYWPPIIDTETHRQLVARLTPTKQRRRARADYLLSGVLTCANCGHVLYATNRSRYATYRCPTETGCVGRVEIQCGLAESEVVGDFLARYGYEEVYYTITETAPEHSHRLAAVESGLRATADELTRPGADMAGLLERLNALRDERELLAAKGPTIVNRRVSAGMTVADLFAELGETPGSVRECRERIAEHLVSAVVSGRAASGNRRIVTVWR